MSAADRLCGWRFAVPEGGVGQMPSGAREALLETVLRTISGEGGAPLRRSRHATTWQASMDGAALEGASLFVKQLDPPRGALGWLKRLLRVRRAEHVARITERLRRDGFEAQRVLLAGYHAPSGREVIVTKRLSGSMVTRLVNPHYAADHETKRAVLHELGAEIARFHGKGYIHGDLTPYNVFLVSRVPIRFAFIDHERTRRLLRFSLFAPRRKMRNLVQLGRFELAGLTRTDRMRVFASYARRAGLSPRRAGAALVRMIETRLERDRARARGAAALGAPLVRPGGAGEG